MTELSPEAMKAIETAEKLMRLAGNNTNQNEAAAATAKAMDLLAAHNLDVSIIEQQGGGAKAARSDEKMAGGLYHYQRNLWQAIAQLNFCWYWNQYVYDPNKSSAYWRRKGVTGKKGGYRFQHRLVGRKVNVIATRNMADYLEKTIDRLVRERIGDSQGNNMFSKWAVNFREGIADEIRSKIFDRRRDLLAEEDRRIREEAERAAQAGRGTESSGRGLTLRSLQQSEYDANTDFLYGEGTAAKWAAERAEAARKQAEADAAYAAWAEANPEAAYAAWAEANPEAAAKEEAKARKESRRRSYGRSKGREAHNTSAYWEGREEGKKVSIDPQAEHKPVGLIR